MPSPEITQLLQENGSIFIDVSKAYDKALEELAVACGYDKTRDEVDDEGDGEVALDKAFGIEHKWSNESGFLLGSFCFEKHGDTGYGLVNFLARLTSVPVYITGGGGEEEEEYGPDTTVSFWSVNPAKAIKVEIIRQRGASLGGLKPTPRRKATPANEA
jgi:hypothetical protein